MNMRNWKKSSISSNNWKHQCYQQTSCTKTKTQQLLGGKLTLSQLKPGQDWTYHHWFYISVNVHGHFLWRAPRLQGDTGVLGSIRSGAHISPYPLWFQHLDSDGRLHYLQNTSKSYEKMLPPMPPEPRHGCDHGDPPPPTASRSPACIPEPGVPSPTSPGNLLGETPGATWEGQIPPAPPRRWGSGRVCWAHSRQSECAVSASSTRYWFGFVMLKQHHFCSEADPNASNNYKKEEEKNKIKKKITPK